VQGQKNQHRPQPAAMVGQPADTEDAQPHGRAIGEPAILIGKQPAMNACMPEVESLSRITVKMPATGGQFPIQYLRQPHGYEHPNCPAYAGSMCLPKSPSLAERLPVNQSVPQRYGKGQDFYRSDQGDQTGAQPDKYGVAAACRQVELPAGIHE